MVYVSKKTERQQNLQTQQAMQVLPWSAPEQPSIWQRPSKRGERRGEEANSKTARESILPTR
jgi:hypothetical protein